MEREAFIIRYAGRDAEKGVIPVSDLAPALKGFSDLCNRANFLLNAEAAQVELQVRGDFREGSFEIFFELWQVIPESARTEIFKAGVANARAILECIGLTSASMGPEGISNLIEFLKWLKGRLPKRVDKNEDGTVTVTATDDSTVVVNQNTINIYGDVHIHHGLEEIAEPLGKNGIETVEIRDPKTSEIARTIDDKERELLALPDVPEEVISESEGERSLEVVSAHFREGLRWRFTAGAGERFTAAIEDESFLEQLDRREVSFQKGDIMRVRLKSKDVMTSKGLKSERTVTKVLEKIPPPKQLSLLEGSGGATGADR